MALGRIFAALGIAGTAAAVAQQWRLRRRRRSSQRISDMVDEAGKESFPASDPPSWTLGEERKL